MTAKVVLTDQVFPDTLTEERILEAADAELVKLQGSSPEAIREGAADADALITTYAPIDAETITALTRCKIIARYGIGVDNIDLEAARRAGIAVTNVPDYCVEEVADHTISLILALTRKLLPGHDSLLQGNWGIAAVRPLHRMKGQILGLVGYGNIGRAVAQRAAAFGMEVWVYDPYLSEEQASPLAKLHPELDAVLTNADVVSIHAPLTDATRGLFDSERISTMKAGAVLVNTSRGPIVRLAAILEALRNGHLSGAGLDVFEQEPPDGSLLRGVPNLIATPHAAFYSEEAIEESQTKAAGCVVAVLNGDEPKYRIV